jgi:hypothetical protein
MEYDFSGVWRNTYHYTSERRGPGEYQSTHYMMAQRRGNQVVFQSMPAKDESFLLVRLRLDGRLATGSWEENSSPTGPFKGTRFYGAIQLVLDEDGKAFRGMWLGVGKKMQVKAGKWEIVHNPQQPTHSAPG